MQNQNTKILWLIIFVTLLYLFLGTIYYRTEKRLEKLEQQLRINDNALETPQSRR